jgi:capsular exopolysaccharide synthesis family protein
VLAAYEKKGPFLNAYRTLRTQVMHRLQENGWKLLGVTSPGKQEGKSLTAINLAISMAMDLTQTVLLVEADFGNPSLHQVFGIADGAGLADYLLENVPLQELLVHPGIDRLMLLPVGRQIPNCSEALTSPRMLSLVKELKTHYPSLVIIFDLPAVLSDPAVLTFMPQIDATLLVVEEAKTTVQDLEHAMELLKGATPIIGTVLNKANHLKAIQRA